MRRRYERLGMRADATLRARSHKSDGRRYDRTIMSITRDEFARRYPELLQRNA